MDDRNQNNIILSYINDYISVPINKTLEKLYKEDFKEYKKTFVDLCFLLKDFYKSLKWILDAYEDD